jgi:hypothetical protein
VPGLHVLNGNLPNALVVASATAAVSFTIAKTKVSAPFRTWVKKHSAWLGALVSCPYCTSHWIMAAAVIVFNEDVRLLSGHGFFDYMATWAAMVAANAIVFGQIGNAVQPPASAVPMEQVPPRSSLRTPPPPPVYERYVHPKDKPPVPVRAPKVEVEK